MLGLTVSGRVRGGLSGPEKGHRYARPAYVQSVVEMMNCDEAGFVVSQQFVSKIQQKNFELPKKLRNHNPDQKLFETSKMCHKLKFWNHAALRSGC